VPIKPLAPVIKTVCLVILIIGLTYYKTLYIIIFVQNIKGRVLPDQLIRAEKGVDSGQNIGMNKEAC
jgi:hypothetical protein